MRKSKWLATLRRPLGAAAAAVVLLVLLLAVFAPILWSDKASALDTTQILRGPSAEHWMGTDSLGRDIFFRVLVATRLSVELAAAATAIGVVAGLLLGTAAVLLGKRLGRFVSAVVDIAVAFPGLLLALFFAVIFGVGARGSVLAIGLAIAPAFARLTRTLVARVLALDYVAAARIVGVRRFRLLGRHILPNVAEPLVVNATITTGSTLLSFAGLSFLGLGVQSPDFDWGRLLRDGLDGLYIHPAGALAPAVAVVVAGLAFSLFGEAVATTIGQAAGSPRRPELAPASPPADVAPAAGGHPVLAVEGLRVTFPGVNPVRGVSFSLGRGESVGVVGESGSGKSVTALALARLIEDPGQVHADRLEFLGKPLPEADRRTLGTSFAMVFQDPMTSFNPTQRVGGQLAEVARYHQGLPRGAAFARAVDRLRAVRLPGAARRARQLPHEFSGGMRQRAMIGMGLMGTPALIVADEPTTALDVTVQRRVLRLLADVREADDVAILLISHDMGVIRQLCDRVLVMYAGRIVEDLPAAELTSDARHPYTRALLAAVPDLTTDRDEPLAVIPGSPADPAELPEGCAFAPRCPFADAQCTAEDPPLVDDTSGHRTACWHPAEALVPEQLQVGEAR